MFFRSTVRILAMASIAPLCALTQQAGVPTDWDIQKLVTAIAEQSARIQPLVEQIRPKEWVAKGASDTYVQQWDSAHAQAQTVKLSADNLVREPQRLSAALDTYFRLQESGSGVDFSNRGRFGKYQNPALADLLRSVLSDNSASRQQLRQYLVDLAAIKEQEFKVMDEEAQRCRESISKLPSAAQPKKNRGSNKIMPLSVASAKRNPLDSAWLAPRTVAIITCAKNALDAATVGGCEVTLNSEEQSQSASASGAEPFRAPEPLAEPPGIPPEDISGEAAI